MKASDLVITKDDEWIGRTVDRLNDIRNYLIELEKHVDALEPKTGHWRREVDFGNMPHYFCSECGNKEDWRTNYCKFCGAKMSERVEEID